MDIALLIPVSLLLIGSAAVVWILWSLVQAIFPQLLQRIQFSQRARGQQSRRGEQQLAKADKCIERGNFAAATELLRSSFVFTQRCKTSAEVEEATSQHLGVLSRLITLSERRGRHLEGLAVAEELVQSRGEIWEELLKTREELRSLQMRRLEDGKQTPQWAVGEFERKIAQLEDRLQTNGRTLKQQFEALVQSLDTDDEPTSRTVH